VRNEEVLHTVTEVRNILHTTKRRKDDWIGHILHRNCLLKHNIEGKIGRLEVTGKQDDISSYWLNLRKQEDTGNWKEEVLDRIMYITHFGKGYGPVV
jgi:hypothetical protein